MGGHFRTQAELYRPGLRARGDLFRLLRMRGVRLGEGASSRRNPMCRRVAHQGNGEGVGVSGAWIVAGKAVAGRGGQTECTRPWKS